MVIVFGKLNSLQTIDRHINKHQVAVCLTSSIFQLYDYGIPLAELLSLDASILVKLISVFTQNIKEQFLIAKGKQFKETIQNN